MPRNQKVDLRRTRKSVQASSSVRGDSPNASIPRPSRHVRRSSRSKSSATPSGSKNSSNAGADRLTRSRTHSARRAATTPKTRVESDREESESEVEESPRKKVKLGKNRSTPAKAKSSTPRKGNRGRPSNVKVNRRKSKQDSEEDEPPEENDSDSEYVQKVTPNPYASRRRSSRSAIRSSGSSPYVTPSNKGLPAVILKRVEHEMNESPKSARSLRGRSSKQRGRAQRKEVTEDPQADETSSGAAVEVRPVASSSPTSTPSRASRPRSVSAAAARQSGGEQRSRTPTKHQPQRKQPARRQQKRSPAKATPSPPQQLQREKRGRASSARQQRQPAKQQRIKMVPSEENAATTTTESLKKDEQEGEEEEEDETTEAVATKKDGSQAAEEEEGETQEQQQQQAPPSLSERGDETVEDDDEDDVKDKQQEDGKKVAATKKDTEAVAATEEKVEEKENPEEDVVPSELDGDKRDSGGDVKTKTDEEECGDKEEKMDVDEPIVNSPEEVTSVAKASGEAESERLSAGEHSTTEAAEEPPKKKSRTDDGETHEDAELDAGTKTTKVEDSPAREDDIKSNDTSDKSSFQDQEVKDDNVGAVNGEESGGVEQKSNFVSPTLTSVNGSAAEEKERTVNDVDDGSEEKDGGSNGYDTENNVIFASLGKTIPRRCVVNSKLSDINTKDVFTVASFNLSDDDWSDKHENLVNEVLQLSPSILCLQEIDEVYFKNSLDSALKSHGYMGLYRAGKAATKGLAMFYLLSSFEILHHREIEVHELLEKDILSSNLADDEKDAVKSFLHSPAPVLITKLKFTSNGKAVTVGTVHLPGDDEDVLAVQAAAVLREILAISGGANDPHVLCGSFNLREDSIVSKVLSEGHLTSDTLNELKAKANVPVPDKEQISLAALLEKGFQHQSTSLRSSYESVLGHELKFPDKSVKLCRDSVWFSSESLLTKSILDVGAVSGETSPNAHISLKAELAFVN